MVITASRFTWMPIKFIFYSIDSAVSRCLWPRDPNSWSFSARATAKDSLDSDSVHSLSRSVFSLCLVVFLQCGFKLSFPCRTDKNNTSPLKNPTVSSWFEWQRAEAHRPVMPLKAGRFWNPRSASQQRTSWLWTFQCCSFVGRVQKFLCNFSQ